MTSPNQSSARTSASPPAESVNKFCNDSVIIEDWYAVCKSSQLKAGEARPVTLGGFELIVRRLVNGTAIAHQRFCPHMGADVTHAKEVKGKIQCAFHGLTFSADGTNDHKCGHTGSLPFLSFPVAEQFGFVFVYLGIGAPKFELPDLGLTKGPLYLTPTRKVRCHHHMLLCNGLDRVHTKFVHTWDSLEYTVEPASRYRVVAKLKGLYRAWWMMCLNNTYRRPLSFTYTTYGSSIAVADVDYHGTRLVILFLSYGDGEFSHTNTGLYIESYNPLTWLRGAAVSFAILAQDVKILEGIQIQQNLTTQDSGVALYRDILNTMPAFEAR